MTYIYWILHNLPPLKRKVSVDYAGRNMGAKLSYPDVELNDKVAIVTGANTGLGYETAKALAFHGAHTIIACRSEQKGQQVLKLLLTA